jgi:hypothetical protein
VRRVSTTGPVRGGDWSGVAALGALGAPLFLIVRRAFRLAAAP